MVKLKIEGVSLWFSPKKHEPILALDNIDLDVMNNEFAVIVGPSGCGKSSLLRLAAGLMQPTAGSIHLDGRLVTKPGKDRGMVFQSYTLYPWLTVQKNVEFGPQIAGTPKPERATAARKMLAQVGLEGFEKRYPKHLSGGMKQRVALARALVNDPDILLMDEPFGALDSQTRSLMQELLLNVWEMSHKTVLFVTHDLDEAIFLGDVVYVMTARPGRIKERIPIDIPRPRSVDVLTGPKFMELKRRVLTLIHDEAVAADG
jgi:ABC-type nitrate/sulfonate/bicarbonate transport system ATPase subunit